MYRYYSIQRPFGPGTFPRQDGTETITNFDGPTYCEEISREAWGYIDYQQPLDDEEASRYELKPAELKKFLVEVTSVHTLEVEAENEDEAIEMACRMAWEYDADEIDGKILEGDDLNA